MPSLPKPARRPWQPAPAKRAYVQHEARDKRYDSPQWRALRAAQLAKEPCCQGEACAGQGRTTAATVADHVQPVRLGGAFFDASNLQSLCYSCHQSKSASERKIPATNAPSDPGRG
jgi:5-methylcytosine-specific restriction protein A